MRRATAVAVCLYFTGFFSLAAHAGEQAPQWTATRAFPVARVYVLPPSAFLLAFDADAAFSLGDSSSSIERTHYAAGWGLGHRLALEASVAVTANGITYPLMLAQQSLGLRWAWALWGELWGNPVVGLNYQANNGLPPSATLQIDLGDSWHDLRWAFDVEVSRDLHGSIAAQTYTAVGAAAYAWADLGLDVGAEAQVSMTDASGQRLTYTEVLFVAGPYLRWLPVPQASIVVDLGAGTQMNQSSDASRQMPIFRPKLVVGWLL